MRHIKRQKKTLDDGRFFQGEYRDLDTGEKFPFLLDNHRTSYNEEVMERVIADVKARRDGDSNDLYVLATPAFADGTTGAEQLMRVVRDRVTREVLKLLAVE